MISVEDSDTARAEKLQRELTNTVDSILQASAPKASVLTQTVSQDAGLEQQAKENHISTGKAALVNRILSRNPSLNFGELAVLSVDELKELAEAATPAMPIGQAAAKSIALDHAGISDHEAYDIDVELDDEKGALIYEVEFKADGMEYDYEIDAVSGNILRCESELDD